MKAVLIAAGVAALLCGCAAAPQTSQALAGPEERLCEREYPIGSSLPVTRCRSAAEREQLREKAQRSLEQLRNDAPAGSGKPGGAS